MPDNPIPYHDGLEPRRPDQPAEPAERRPETAGPLGSFRVNARARLQAAKVEAVAQVGGTGMRATTWLTKLELELGQSCPAAAPRLEAMAELTTYAVAEVVAATNRFLR